jgi:DNA-directed RNA polymerase subunit M/transcription elongation factor TFIIS
MCGFNVNADELEDHVIVTRAVPKSSIRKKGKKEEDKSNDRAIVRLHALSPPLLPCPLHLLVDAWWVTVVVFSSLPLALSCSQIDEKCPKCGHGKMYFYTMQLRSVDEGSTVFYECVKCAYV